MYRSSLAVLNKSLENHNETNLYNEVFRLQSDFNKLLKPKTSTKAMCAYEKWQNVKFKQNDYIHSSCLRVAVEQIPHGHRKRNIHLLLLPLTVRVLNQQINN